MRKNTLNFVVDLLTLLAILVLIATGLIMKFTLPPGTGGRGVILWSMTRHEWGDVHFWTSLSLAVLLILHVALHWSWVCGTIRRLVHGPSLHRGRPGGGLDNLYGVAFFVILAAAFTAFLFLTKANVTQSPAAAGAHEREHEAARFESPGIGRAADGLRHERQPAPASTHIRGSMTLDDIARQTGVPLPQLLAALRWPPDTPPNERLGRLCRHHGTDIEAARQIIARQTPPSSPDE